MVEVQRTVLRVSQILTLLQTLFFGFTSGMTRYSGDRGYITSQGYPKTYNSNEDSIYKFELVTGDNVMVELTLDIEKPGANGCSDFVRLGETEESLLDDNNPLTFCGSVESYVHSVKQKFIFIRFYSDSQKSTGIGFKAQLGRYISYTGTSGTFASPNFPSPYPESTRVYYHVTVDQAYKVMVRFLDMVLQESKSGACMDYLVIYRYKSETSKEIIPVTTQLCRRDFQSPVVVLPTSSFILSFYSDSIYVNKGFSATWAIYQAIEDDRTILTSPSYPSLYQSNTTLYYDIKLAKKTPETSILFIFTDWEFEEREDRSCKDYLEIWNAPVEKIENNNFYGQFCGMSIASNERLRKGFITKSSGVTFLLKTNANQRFRGFRVEYGALLEFKSDTGDFLSPGYPLDYPLNMRQFYRISLGSYGYPMLKIVEFHLQPRREDGSCRDYLKIYHGDYVDGIPVGKYCERELYSDQKLYGKMDSFFMEFYSDASERSGGFVIAWKKYQEKHIADSGWLQSPNYPSDYGSSEDVEYNLRLVSPGRIAVEFLQFKLQPKTTSGCVDSLEIYDGDAKGASLGKFCGEGIRPYEVIPASGKSIYMRFTSDKTNNTNGFWARFGVYHSFHNDTGTLSSVNFPKPYPNNHRAYYYITLKKPGTINIRVDAFGVNGTRDKDCLGDILQIYEGYTLTTAKTFGRYCGKDLWKGGRLKLLSPTAILVFTTDATGTGQGFELVWSREPGDATPPNPIPPNVATEAGVTAATLATTTPADTNERNTGSQPTKKPETENRPENENINNRPERPVKEATVYAVRSVSDGGPVTTGMIVCFVLAGLAILLQIVGLVVCAQRAKIDKNESMSSGSVNEKLEMKVDKKSITPMNEPIAEAPGYMHYDTRDDLY